MARYLLDTNLLLRTVQKKARQHAEALKAVSELLRHGNQLHITPQVLIEFWAVVTRPPDANEMG